ncbi:retrovirus-related pol polyprotein from transposon TNT 1-94 [Tanacetum coccineum]|uniref:Retrovirus-related pol polyprotein from transposon TNT 1-94 n=1 Tax=Tanacetum coccineum TaxID=301880 RepID=A0ABQ4X9V3_9ASTR
MWFFLGTRMVIRPGESWDTSDGKSTVTGARETVGSQVVQQTGIQYFNCKEFGHFAKKCRKPKRVKDYTYHKEKMLMCKQAEKGVPLQAKQADWLEDTDEEIDEQELEAHYSYIEKIQEVPTADSGTDTGPLEQVQYDAKYNVFVNERQHSEQPESISNTCVVEKVDSNVIPDLPNMCDNDIQIDQNAKECDDERVALANLIANLTLDTEENKNILKQLKKANASLTQELKECKSNLEESNTTRDSCLISLQSKQIELETYKTLIDRIVDYDKLEHKLNETLGLLAQKEIDLKEGLKLKAYEISVVKEKHGAVRIRDHGSMKTATSFQLDENRFILDANLLREALEITPIDQAHQFVSPPSGDAIMDFVNELGYTEEIHFVSRMAISNSSDALGIITSTNVDYAELMWEEVVQAMQTFLVDKANLSTAHQKGKKNKPHVIPYCRFTKLIICHLGRTHNIHQRSASLFHLAEEDHRLGNLKFVPKGEDDEGGKRKLATKADKSKKPATAKQLKLNPVKEKLSKPAPAPKPKVTREKPSKPSPAKHPKRGKALKIRKGKSPLQPIDEDEPTQPELEPELEHQGEAEATRPLPVVEGKGKAIATKEQAAQSLLALHTPKRRSADTDKINSGGDTEILQIGEEQGEDVANIVDQEEKTAEINEGQAGSDLGKTPESRPPSERVLMEEDQAGPDPGLSHVALARPDPETDPEPYIDDSLPTVYPQVHESLKHPDEEHVHEENPLSFFRPSFSISTLVIDLSLPKPVPSTTQALIFTATTATITTTLPLPPPPQQQSKKYSELVAHVTTLENKFFDFEQKSKNIDNTTQNLGSRVFTLELQDLPYKINQTVNDVVKEAVHVAFQAPL